MISPLVRASKATMDAAHKALGEDQIERRRIERLMIEDGNQAHRYGYLGPNTEHENNIVNATRRAMRDTSKHPKHTRAFLRSFFNAKLIELADLDERDTA